MAEQKKKTGKKALGSILYILICAVFGGLIGLMLAESNVEFNLAQTLFVFLFFVAALLLHIILHEAGHMIAGMMTGYKFLSFRIGSLMMEKQKDGKIHFSNFSIAGTGGQCLMCPPDYNDGNFPYVLYNLGGVLMNAILSIAAAVIALLLPVGPWMKVFLWMMVFVGVLTGLMNGIPIKTKTVNNDGSNIVTIGKSAVSKRAFWLQMKINEEGAYGVRLRDMPAEWFEVPDDGEQNAMTASIRVFKTNRLMDALQLDEAEGLIRVLSGNQAIPGVYKSLMCFDLAYCELIKGKTDGAAERLQEKDMQVFIKMMKNFPSVIRTQYAVAMLKDQDMQAAEKHLQHFEQMAKTYPRFHELESERDMIHLAQEKAKENAAPAEA